MRDVASAVQMIGELPRVDQRAPTISNGASVPRPTETFVPSTSASPGYAGRPRVATYWREALSGRGGTALGSHPALDELLHELASLGSDVAAIGFQP
jgi:hypothetical protein